MPRGGVGGRLTWVDAAGRALVKVDILKKMYQNMQSNTTFGKHAKGDPRENADAPGLLRNSSK